MNNLVVSLVLAEIASLLEIKGANQYKIRAYQKASKKVKELDNDIKVLIEEDKLTNLSGVGSSLAQKIEEIILTGSCDYYQRLTKEYPRSLIPLLKLSGVGASKLRKFYNKLGIKDLIELKNKAEAGDLSQISGIGSKTEKKILASAKRLLSQQDRIDIGEAVKLANKIKEYLKEIDIINRIEVVGSLRRASESINQISFVIETEQFKEVINLIKELLIVHKVLSKNKREIIFLTRFGIKLRLIKANKLDFLQKLFWLTGTHKYNEELKRIIASNNINEIETDLKSEREIFKAINLPYIIPELRDDLESLEQAQVGNLPVSIDLEDIKGDLHMHSQWSDGRYSIEEMARACQHKGYQYLAICDHTQSLTVANGLTPDKLKSQWEIIDRLNEELDILILKGAEVDILDEGLDYTDRILEKLDIVIASIHSGFKDSQEKMMSRIFRALENPHVNILGHPTGRLVIGRGPYSINFENLIHKAIETNTVLEINAAPKRLDLNSEHVKLAHRLGANFVINTDAHHIKQLDNMKYGVGIARKGWLEREDVVNTFNLEELNQLLRL